MESRIGNLLRQLAIAYDDLEADNNARFEYLTQETQNLKKQLFIMSSGLISIGSQLKENLGVNEIDFND